MIKEFWQEHREQKKQLKKERKQSKKHPKTKEQVAYKVFGIIFVIGLMIGSVAFCCRGTGDVPPSYSWDNIIGITDEMKTALTKSVDEKELFDDAVDIVDWSMARDKLVAGGLGKLIVNDSVDVDKLNSKEVAISSNIDLKENELCALVSKMTEGDEYEDYLQLLFIDIYWEDTQAYLKTIIKMDLSFLIAGTELPQVYVTTVSCLDILNEDLASVGEYIQLNQVEKKLNDEIVETINKNSLLDISVFTNSYVVSIMNVFIDCINADVEIQNNGIRLVTK
ncbi:MAG: hypothetical protein IJW59_02680 [Clostridia bacterium]|nr:hypothetical protein [Clostridia bacterium]